VCFPIFPPFVPEIPASFKSYIVEISLIWLRSCNHCYCMYGRNIFKELNILSFASQYIFSLLVSVLQNKVLFPSNIDSHTIDTRQRQDL
jgi:hypothetical protein